MVTGIYMGNLRILQGFLVLGLLMRVTLLWPGRGCNTWHGARDRGDTRWLATWWRSVSCWKNVEYSVNVDSVWSTRSPLLPKLAIIGWVTEPCVIKCSRTRLDNRGEAWAILKPEIACETTFCKAGTSLTVCRIQPVYYLVKLVQKAEQKPDVRSYSISVRRLYQTIFVNICYNN